MVLKKTPWQTKPVLEFADSTVNLIDELISKSKNIEFGGVLCLDANNKIYLENVVKGTESGIDEMPDTCEEGMRPIGSFHTHPEKDVDRISSSDYNYHVAKQEIITCIGQQIGKKRKLTCIVYMPMSEKEAKEREHLISELGEAEVYFQMIACDTKEEAEKEIKKEGHYDKLKPYFNWLNVEYEV